MTENATPQTEDVQHVQSAGAGAGAALTPLERVVSQIKQDRPGDVIEISWCRDEVSFTVRVDTLIDFMSYLRSESGGAFVQLVDLCGCDDPSLENRFTVVYNLLSLKENVRVRVKVYVSENQVVPSVVSLFSAAGWFEREAYDMYGIVFAGNADLRRILTDYGFEGYPLRKDFPMTGFVELRYDDLQKRVVYAPVELQQAYRSFDNVSPWEGMTDVQLPGDEKASKPTRGWVPANGDVPLDAICEQKKNK